MIDLRIRTNLSMIRDISMRQLAANNIWMSRERGVRRRNYFDVVRNSRVMIARPRISEPSGENENGGELTS
jgi:hypothetical protein